MNPPQLSKEKIMARITDIAKFATDIVVGLGTTKIVNDTIRKNVEAKSTSDKITIGAASFAIGGTITEATSKYTHGLIDQVEELVTSVTQHTSDTNEN